MVQWRWHGHFSVKVIRFYCNRFTIWWWMSIADSSIFLCNSRNFLLQQWKCVWKIYRKTFFLEINSCKLTECKCNTKWRYSTPLSLELDKFWIFSLQLKLQLIASTNKSICQITIEILVNVKWRRHSYPTLRYIIKCSRYLNSAFVGS